MILVLKPNPAPQKVQELLDSFHAKGFATNVSEGTQHTIIGLIGDTSRLDADYIATIDIVESAKRISEPYKAVNRKIHPQDTHVTAGDVTIGEGLFQVIAGPCSVESEEQIIRVAQSVKASGATLLRGGAFKPRTSPYAFQGLHADGIRLLLEAKHETGLPIVTEIMNADCLGLFSEVDVIQVGARNMQNFDLLRELGHCNKPILLKRGLANTVEEWLMSAEYILSGGNQKVILCERGVRTFETMTRNTLDISAIPLLKRLTHLPVIVDPSHATGHAWLVPPLARTVVAAGADGLMVEGHNDPANALCDGAQSLDLPQFSALMEDLKKRVLFEGKKLQ